MLQFATADAFCERIYNAAKWNCNRGSTQQGCGLRPCLPQIAC